MNLAGGIVFGGVLITWAIVAVAVCVALFFVSAPYGRYFRANFGPAVNGRLGWIAMEAPAPLIFAVVFVPDVRLATLAQIVFLAMWEMHYLDRAFLYPMTLRVTSKPLPMVILALGFLFNVVNAYLNVHYITVNNLKYAEPWLRDVRFLAGTVVFLVGFIVNRHSDYVLYRIRRVSGTEYGIPERGLYRWVSCPNYLGEIVVWIGWSIATWSPVGAAFSLWSVANLAPRAWSHHQWYRRNFTGYPDNRRALVPWLW